MAQWVKVLGAKPGDLSSNSGIHLIGGESIVLKGVLRPPHTAPKHTSHTHKQVSETGPLHGGLAGLELTEILPVGWGREGLKACTTTLGLTF